MTSPEHPFAQYIRILGKGPKLSRDLTQEEARAAFAHLLSGTIEPVQMGAFLCLLRVRTESEQEIAGFVQAIHDARPPIPSLPPIDLDWPSYAGKSRQLPLFLLSALLLAGNGITVLMHGGVPHTAGRIFSDDALSHLGIRPVADLQSLGDTVRTGHFAYVPLELIHPALPPILALKPILGLRSPLNTLVRNLNPFDARGSLMSVFHPNYRAVHQGAARLLGQRLMGCFKGEGGEIERRPEKPCLVEGLREGISFSIEWPARLDRAPEREAAPGGDLLRLAALWRGEATDAYAEATIAATAAVALHLLGRAANPDEADAMAEALWRDRDRKAFPA